MYMYIYIYGFVRKKCCIPWYDDYDDDDDDDDVNTIV